MLRPCTETILVDSTTMSNYQKITGDNDGVVIQGTDEGSGVSSQEVGLLNVLFLNSEENKVAPKEKIGQKKTGKHPRD